MTSKPSSGSRSELLKMSVIIRLQGLPWSASALDIRHFFKGLTIPAGGVHIIGGDRGDAFIAFSSDEDARQAMMRNNASISGTTAHLYLSSKSEMQSVIEEARSSEAAAAAGGGAAATSMVPQQGGGMQQGGMQQGGMPQGGMQQGGMMQGGMQQGGMLQGGMQQGGMREGGIQQGGVQQGGMQSGGMSHMGMQHGGMQHGGMQQGGHQQPGGMQQGGAMQQGGYQHGGMQQGGMQQPGMQGDMPQGVGQGFQGQQGYPGAQGMNNQRFPQQSNFQMGRDMGQGQFPAGQNFMGQVPNQMQGQMPGQQGRDNQFGMQGDGTQGMNQQNFQTNNQQNYPQDQQQLGQGGPPGQGGQPNQGGMNNQQGFPGNVNQGNNGNSGQPNQFGTGYGFGMEGNYGGNNYNQWQNMGQGQGQDTGSSQQFYGGENNSQGRFPNQQSNQQSDQQGQNTGGQDRQLFPHQQQQQQFPGQMGETMQKPDSFAFNQQGGFGQEGMQQGSDNSGRFPNRPGPPGMNRGGILPHPPMPGQEQAASRLPDSQGQVPPRPGPGSRGTPDSHLRSPASGRSESQPPVDQWPGMQKGQDQKKPAASSEEGYVPQESEGEGVPPRRGDRFPPRGGMQQADFPGSSRDGMQQGEFPDGSRGGMQQGEFPGGSRGGTQGDFLGGSRGGMQGEFPGGSRGGMKGEFPGGFRGGMQQGEFPGGSRGGMKGEFPGGSRGGMQGEFPGGSRGGMQGEFPGGSRGGMQGEFPGGSRGGMQQEFPGGSRGGMQQGEFPGGSRGSMQQEEFPGGSRGGMQQGEFPGGPRGRGILPTPNMPMQGQQGGFNKDPLSDMDAMEHGQWPGYDAEGPMDRSEGPPRDVRQDPDFRRLEPMGGPGRFTGDSDFRNTGQGRGGFEGPVGGRPFDGPEGGRPMDGPRGRFDTGPDQSMERGPGGRPLLRDPDARIQEMGPGGRPLLRDPDARMQEMGPDGRPLLQGPVGRSFEGAQDRRSLEGGPDGQAAERGPDGRPFDRGQDIKSFDGGPNKDTDVRVFDRSQNRGPDDRGFDPRPFGGEEEGCPFGNYRSRLEGDEGCDPGSRFDGPDGRFDGPHDRCRFQGPPKRSRFSSPGGRFDSPGDGHRLEGPADSRFSQHESYDPMDMDIDSQDYEEQGERSSQDRGFPGPRGFDDQDRGNEGRGGRGAGLRGRGTFNRGRGQGIDRGFPPYRHPRDEGYPRYPGEGFDNQPFEGVDRGEMHRFPDELGNQYSGNQDFDSRQDFGRGRGNAERGPRGRMDRGRGRFDMGMVPDRDMDSDRRPNRDDMDSRGRDRNWDTDELRGTGKGLLGDAPTGLLQDPAAKQEEDRDSRNLLQRDIDSPRDRDRRSHSDRRDREDRDRGREDRFGRRFERRRSRDRSRERSRDKSPDRDRYSRRSDRDRDRDRSDRRDRDRDRERSSHNRDRDSRSRDSNSRESASKDISSKDVSSKETSSVKKENEKDSEKKEAKTDAKKQTESADSPPTEGKYIHVKGFPITYNYREIRRFFFGCELPFDGIKIINDIQGQRTGEVYLKFVNEETAKRAFRKNGETIFGKAVILEFTTNKVFESQIDSQTPPASSDSDKPAGPVPIVKKDQEKNNLIIMIQGLPFSIKREDLIKFFSSVKIADNGDAVFIEYDSRNQATGVAYMETASVQDYKSAIGHDGRLFGARALKVTAGRREDMDLCIKKQQEMFERQTIRMGEPPMPPQPGMGPGPGPMGPRPGLMGQGPGRPGPPGPMMNPMNMPVVPPRNGPAFDPSLALQRQQQQQQQQQPPPQPQQQQQGDGASMDQSGTQCVHIQGLPMLATYKDIREFFSDLNIVANRGIQIVHDGLGKPMGEGFVEFATQEDKEKALKRDKTSMGRHILAVKSVAKNDMLERLRNARFVGLPPGQGPPPGHPNIPPRLPEPNPIPNPNPNPIPNPIPNPNPNSNSNSNPNPNPSPMKPIPPGVLNRQWCYLSCQNFPPAVSITEILSFFQKYNPIPESIRLHYAADGSPTGNAVVGFLKIEEANRALQEMNNKRCRQSIVTLMPAI